MTGSGGVGMVAIGVPWWIALPVLLAVALLLGFGVWKVIKTLWAIGG